MRTHVNVRFLNSISEAFVEAVPQLHLLLCFAVMEPTLFVQGTDSNRTMFLITLSSSIFCAAFGITKFMKTGPCRLVSDGGFGGGFVKLGFLLAMVNVCSILLSKGFLVLLFGHIFGPSHDLPAIGAWIGINYIPHMIYVRKLHNTSKDIYLHTLFCSH